MDQRKGDPRIYIITILFLSCIISGGVFLGLYLLLPDPNPLFLQAGMIFVGVPWFFWFLAYCYSCILKPCTVSVTNSFDLEKAEKTIPESAPAPAISVSENDETAKSSPKEGEKHVQFGDVVVFGNENEEENNQNEGSSNNLIQNRIEEDEDEEHKGNLISKIDNDESSSVDEEECDKTPLRSSSTKK